MFRFIKAKLSECGWILVSWFMSSVCALHCGEGGRHAYLCVLELPNEAGREGDAAPLHEVW